MIPISVDYFHSFVDFVESIQHTDCQHTDYSHYHRNYAVFVSFFYSFSMTQNMITMNQNVFVSFFLCFCTYSDSLSSEESVSYSSSFSFLSFSSFLNNLYCTKQPVANMTNHNKTQTMQYVSHTSSKFA